MKKILKIFILGLLVTLLAACGSEAKIEDVFEKTINASNDLKSFSLDMTMEQRMGDGSGQSMDTVIKANMDIIQEPISLYQRMEMDMDFDGMGGQIATESYFTEDGFFMHDNLTNQWQKMPDEMFTDMIQLSDQQTDPTAQLEQLEKFVEDFTFEEDDSNYILSLKASGDEFIDVIKEMSLDMLGEDLVGQDLDSAFEGLTIDKLDYTIYVDKGTYLPSKVDLDMQMTMEIEGEKLTVSQTTSGTYTNINEVDAISVPQEVLDSAVDAF